MLWLLTLHIAALLLWGATLLYLPSLIARGALNAQARARGTPEAARIAQDSPGELPWQQGRLTHFLFTLVATPAALLAIVAGTLVFLLDRRVEAWLLAKLTLVTLLVFAHVGNGLLLLRVRTKPDRLHIWCWLLAGFSTMLMLAIISIVLGKPAEGLLP